MNKSIFNRLVLGLLVLGLVLMAAPLTLAQNPHEKTGNPATPTVELPLVAAWYDGRMGYYIQTEASDPDVAADQGVNLVPQLSDAIAAGVTDDIYVVTNFNQANVIPSAPIPTGPNNADPDYTPLWQVSLVTWADDAKPHTLRSEADVLAAEAAGLVTITQTTVVVNCPVMFTRQGGLLPTADINFARWHWQHNYHCRQAIKTPTVELPLVAAWYDGKMGYYIQTEASNPDVAVDQGVNLVPQLSDSIAGGVTDDIYVITNFDQANIIPSAPIPTGPENADPDYTPLWQVSLVTWNEDVTSYVLRSEEDVNAAQEAGLITITQTTVVVNCPVMFTVQGGALPTADINFARWHGQYNHNCFRYYH